MLKATTTQAPHYSGAYLLGKHQQMLCRIKKTSRGEDREKAEAKAQMLSFFACRVFICSSATYEQKKNKQDALEGSARPP